MRRSLERTALALLTFLIGAVRPPVGTAQQGDVEPATPAAVTSVTFGEMGGRGSEYLPESVLGLPDTTGGRDAAATDPKQIVSLGLGGEIVLDFGERIVLDRPGADLVIFENPFLYRLGGNERLYAEPAEVSVSRDGVEWISFPFDSLSFAGAAGVTPVNGTADPFDPEVSGGDILDLAEIGVDSIRYVRLVDVTQIIRDDRDHPLWDITLNGFDLDAVIAYHTVRTDGFLSVDESGERPRLIERTYRNGDLLEVDLSVRSVPEDVSVEVFRIDGRRVASITAESGSRVTIPLPGSVRFILRASSGRRVECGIW